MAHLDQTQHVRLEPRREELGLFPAQNNNLTALDFVPYSLDVFLVENLTGSAFAPPTSERYG